MTPAPASVNQATPPISEDDARRAQQARALIPELEVAFEDDTGEWMLEHPKFGAAWVEEHLPRFVVLVEDFHDGTFTDPVKDAVELRWATTPDALFEDLNEYFDFARYFVYQIFDLDQGRAIGWRTLRTIELFGLTGTETPEAA